MIKLFGERKGDNSWEKPLLLKGEFLEHNEKEKYVLVRIDTDGTFGKKKEGCWDKKIIYDFLPAVEKVILGYNEERGAVIPLRTELANINDCKKGSNVLIQPLLGHKVEEQLEEGLLKVGRIVLFENKE